MHVDIGSMIKFYTVIKFDQYKKIKRICDNIAYRLDLYTHSTVDVDNMIYKFYLKYIIVIIVAELLFKLWGKA